MAIWINRVERSSAMRWKRSLLMKGNLQGWRWIDDRKRWEDLLIGKVKEINYFTVTNEPLTEWLVHTAVPNLTWQVTYGTLWKFNSLTNQYDSYRFLWFLFHSWACARRIQYPQIFICYQSLAGNFPFLVSFASVCAFKQLNEAVPWSWPTPPFKAYIVTNNQDWCCSQHSL